MKHGILALLLLATAMQLTSCDEDTFSSSPMHQPYFTADTLAFDTLISTIPSSTKSITLHNPTSEDLLIGRIYLNSGGASGFRINVDGHPGTDFRDIELWARDSLYIFVEASLPETGNALPQPVNDEIIVETNGVRQILTLHAHAQDAHLWYGRTLAQDTTLTQGKPWVIYDSLVVAEGVRLTCMPGVRMLFHAGSELKVRGTLRCEGNARNPIVFRGDRTDRLFSYLPYDRTPGLWQGIRFFSSSMDNLLDGIDLHSAIIGVCGDSAAATATPRLLIHNSRIHNSSQTALFLEGMQAEITNSLITNSANNLVYLRNGDYRFTHCSLLNFYAFSARGGSIVLGDASDSLRIRLINCLLSGKKNTSPQQVITMEEKGITLTGNEERIRVEHATSISDRTNYLNLNKDGDFVYDFRPTTDNLGINTLFTSESQAAAAALPFDLNGISRVIDEAPDAGCYEYKE